MAKELAAPVRGDLSCRRSCDKSGLNSSGVVQPRARSARCACTRTIGGVMSETNTGGGTGDGGRLGRIPEQVAQQAAGIGRAVGDAVGPKAEDIANRSTAAGADAVAGVARTAEALADTVAPNAPALAEYVRGAGQKIEPLGSDLMEK